MIRFACLERLYNWIQVSIMEKEMEI